MIRAFIAALIASSAVAASWIPDAQAQSAQQQPSAQYSDAELKTFAVVALNVQKINETYLWKLEGAESADEKQKVRQAASNEMVQAVQSQGMTVEKFNEIAVQARQRPEIAERIQQHIRDAK